MKDIFGKIIEFIFAVIAEILNFLDDTTPILLLVVYRLIIIILLYDIVKHLEILIKLVKGG